MVISTGTTLPTCAWAAAGWLRWHLPACSLDSSLALAALQLLHLVERKLHRGLAAEDRHQHLDLLLVRVDLGDRAGQLRERPRRHGDRLADLPLDPRLELLDRLGLEDLGDFLLGERRRLGAGPDEAGDPGCVAD